MSRTDKVFKIIVFLGAFTIYSSTLLPDIGFWDGPYLIRMAHELDLGIGPNQHPIYLLAVKIFLLLPIGDIAVRGNLHSAFWAALAVMQFYCFLKLLDVTRFWSTVGATVWATSQIFWWSATEAEVYTMTIFMFLALLCSVVSHVATGDHRMGLLATFIFFLGLSVHPMVGLCLPAVLIFYGKSRRPRDLSSQTVLSRLGIGLLGLAPLGALFILAAVDGSFLSAADELRGASFTKFFSSLVSLRQWPSLIGQFFLLVVGQFGAFPLLALPFGLIALRKRRNLLWLLMSILLVDVFFVVNYAVEDRVYFYMPAFLTTAILIAVGYQWIALKSARFVWLKRGFIFLTVMFLFLRPQQFRQYITMVKLLQNDPKLKAVVQFIPHTPGRNDLEYTISPIKSKIRPARFYHDLLLQLPEGGIVIDDWLHGYPIMQEYYQQILKLRPDVTVLRWRYFLDTEEQKQAFVERIVQAMPQAGNGYLMTTLEFPLDDFLARLNAASSEQFEVTEVKLTGPDRETFDFKAYLAHPLVW